MSAHSEWARAVGHHCSFCGAPWNVTGNPHGAGLCEDCGGGLPCRADTTDPVAPDPPCQGFRWQMVTL